MPKLHLDLFSLPSCCLLFFLSRLRCLLSCFFQLFVVCFPFFLCYYFSAVRVGYGVPDLLHLLFIEIIVTDIEKAQISLSSEDCDQRVQRLARTKPFLFVSDCERVEGIVLAVSELLHEGLADVCVAVRLLKVESMETAISGDCLASKLQELLFVIVYRVF